MRELHIACHELRQGNDVRVQRHHALPKKGQLITKLATVRGCEVSGEVPPFRLELGMVSMIRRKLILPTRQGRSPIGLCAGRQKAQEEKRSASSARDDNIHALGIVLQGFDVPENDAASQSRTNRSLHL